MNTLPTFKCSLFRLQVMIAAVVLFSTELSLAERGCVQVQVQDAQGHPLRGVEIEIEGIGGSKVTGDDGKAKLPVGDATTQSDWLSLAILRSPKGKDLVMISPWDGRAQVPSFEGKPENFIRI